MYYQVCILHISTSLQGTYAPEFYGIPMTHVRDIAFRPIVSIRGTATYEVAKMLTRVLRPPVGKSSCHLKNTKDFVYQVCKIQLQEGECITSYDVTVL